MKMLSDWSIRAAINHERLTVEPVPTDELIQPASLDLRLGSSGLRWRLDLGHDFIIDPSEDVTPYMEEFRIPTKEEGGLILNSYEFVLANVLEYVELSEWLAAFLHGKSSIGRLALFVHITAGLIDPGWRGVATLELFNAAPYRLRIWQGMLIAQMTFEELSTSSKRPYGSPGRNNRYQGDMQVASSRFHLP